MDYDANDNLTSVTNVGQASSLSQTFDAYNRVSSFKDVYGNLIQYRYDANGNVTNLIYPGGRTVTYFYDNLNRMTNVTDWTSRKTSIAYDLAGRVTSITRPNGTYRTIGYDAAGQATNILEQTALGFPIALFKFNWNNAAEVQWEFAAPLPQSATVPTRTMTYDDDNRLATVDGNSVTMDSDGNMMSGLLTNDTFATYTYDSRNRLQNAGGVTNGYDPMNNRVGITYGTNSVAYVVNPNAALSQVLMRVKNGVTNYYIYGVGLLYEVTETATATNTLTYHYDYRGSTIALSDGNGNVTDRMEYSAYATLTYRTGTHDTPFLFNGRYGVMTDPNGLLYMRARYYNPYLCRFLNADPSGFSGGLNFYAYADGNPVSYLDPFGLGTLGENNISPSSYNLGGENLVSTSTPPYPYGPIISETQVLGHYGVYSIPGPTSLGLGAIGPTGQPFWDTQVTFSQSFNGSGLQTYNSQVTTTGTIWPGGACNTIAGTSFGAGSMLFNMSAAPGNYLVNVYASFNLNGTGGGGAEAILYLGTNRQPILYGSTDYPLSLQTNFSIPVTVPASGSTTSPFFIYSPSIGINQGPTASGAANGTFNFLVIPH